MDACPTAARDRARGRRPTFGVSCRLPCCGVSVRRASATSVSAYRMPAQTGPLGPWGDDARSNQLCLYEPEGIRLSS